MSRMEKGNNEDPAKLIDGKSYIDWIIEKATI